MTNSLLSLRLIAGITACCAAAAITACSDAESGQGEAGDAITSKNGDEANDTGGAGSNSGSGTASGTATDGAGTSSTDTSNGSTNGSGTIPTSTNTSGGNTSSVGTGTSGSGTSGSGTSGSGTSPTSSGSDVTGAGGAMGAGGQVAGAGGSTGAGGATGAGGSGGDEIDGMGGATGMGGSPGNGGTGGDDSGAGMDGAGGALGNGGSGGEGGMAMADDCPAPNALPPGNEYCSNTRGDAGSGYGYELWADGGGSGCMTVHGVDATFSASWNGVEDFLARVGLDFDQTRTHAEIGNITASFQETKSDDGGLTYIGLYGWTVNPLREFYILDDWGMEKPGGFSSDGTPRDEVGTLMADGETYDVWKKTRENKPSIQGDATFDQYFSIRRSARQCGTVSVSEHFHQWEELGLPMGDLYEVKWLVEAQFNSGSVEFTTATVEVD